MSEEGDTTSSDSSDDWERVSTCNSAADAHKQIKKLQPTYRKRRTGYTCSACGAQARVRGTDEDTFWIEKRSVCKCTNRSGTKKKAGAFECTFEGCNKVFTFKSNMKRHLLTHEAPKKKEGEVRFDCTECDKSYSTANGLRYHMQRAHGPGKAYTCLSCGHSTKIRWHLKRHYKSSAVCAEKLRLIAEEQAKDPNFKGSPLVAPQVDVKRLQAPTFTTGFFKCRCGWFSCSSFARDHHKCHVSAMDDLKAKGLLEVQPAKRKRERPDPAEEAEERPKRQVRRVPEPETETEAETETETESSTNALFSIPLKATRLPAERWRKQRDIDVLLTAICG